MIIITLFAVSDEYLSGNELLALWPACGFFR